jgi:hypothetical protein
LNQEVSVADFIRHQIVGGRATAASRIQNPPAKTEGNTTPRAFEFETVNSGHYSHRRSSRRYLLSAVGAPCGEVEYTSPDIYSWEEIKITIQNLDIGVSG